MTDDEVLFPTWDESYTKSSRLKRATNPNNSLGLTKYLEEEFLLRLNCISINRAAIQGTIARWLRSGISPEQIRGMIKVYVNNGEYYRSPGPHWKKFLYHRDTLLERTSATPDSYWDGDGTPEQEFQWD